MSICLLTYLVPCSSDSDIDAQVLNLSKMIHSQLWECRQCGKQATQRSDLKKHIEASHMNLTLHCDFCGDTFKARHHRQQHLRNVHGVSSLKH